jgi:two-component system cell cycle sensor histidine kinase/response regulator CckA
MDPLLLLNSLEAGVAAISPGWRVSSWSPSAARLTGRPADEVIGAELWSAFPATRRADIEQRFSEVLADGIPRTVTIPSRSLEWGPTSLEIEACRAADGHLLLLIREAPPPVSLPVGPGPPEEEDLEFRLYARFFELLPTPALLLTHDGQIVHTNQAALGFLGIGPGSGVRGRVLTDWVRLQDLPTALRAAATETQRLTVAVEVPGRDSTREAQLTLAATDPGGDSSRLLCLVHEITREILLQRRLLQADRLSQLGALVSGVAHELNNPLAAIAAFAELLKEGSADAAVAESAHIIHGEALRAGRVIQTLLDFAKHQQRTLQPVAIPDVVDRVLALQRTSLKKCRITTSVAFGSQIPHLRGDPRELQQVLLNAVVNASQAIAATGRPGRIEITARESDAHVVVSVEDSGPGVPPEVLERAFEPFFSTKGEEGTGLGLSLSSGLVRAMGGRMWLQNVEGSGARLSFELPLDTAPAAVPAPVGSRMAVRPLRVLIVEDLPALRRGMELMTRRLGHDPTTAAGLGAARALLADPATDYEALLVDVHLEEGHSGFDLFQQLRQEGKGRERRVVFTTGDSISPQTRDRLERADRPVLRKPFALDDLRDILDRLA